MRREAFESSHPEVSAGALDLCLGPVWDPFGMLECVLPRPASPRWGSRVSLFGDLLRHGQATIRLRAPSGATIQRCFPDTALVQSLFEFAAVADWDGPKGQAFDLRTSSKYIQVSYSYNL